MSGHTDIRQAMLAGAREYMSEIILNMARHKNGLCRDLARQTQAEMVAALNVRGSAWQSLIPQVYQDLQDVRELMRASLEKGDSNG